jgi:uncharacterized membrane protein YqhA
MKLFERLFEGFLWNSRWITILPVFFSVLIAFGLFLLATVDVIGVLVRLTDYIDPSLTEAARSALQSSIISGVVGAIDVYLIAALMLIFAIGLYELFIGKVDVLENSEFGSRLLLIKTFDDLKDRLASVVQVVLIVKFFQIALALKYQTVLDLFLLGVGITLIGASLFLTSKKKASAADDKDA